MAFGFEKWMIEQKNNDNRRIPTISKRIRIEDLLLYDIGPEKSLLLHGDVHKRKSILKNWLEIQYHDEEAAKHPVVIISRKDKMINDVDFRDEVYLVDSRHKCYEPFLSMNSGTVKEVIRTLLKDTELSIEKNTWTVFDALISMLDTYGYEPSLFNFRRFYKQDGTEGERMDAKTLSGLLEEAGYPDAAKLLRREDGGSDFFTEMKQPIARITYFFEGIASTERDGVSLLDEVKKAWEEDREMPVFYFVLPNENSGKLLDYLAAELKAAADYASPVLILDSIVLRKPEHPEKTFYEYLFQGADLALTISAEDCTALASDEDLEKLLGLYGFYMILGKSTGTVEKLTKLLGTYESIEVDEHKGKGKEWGTLFPRDVHDGFGSRINYDRSRLRHQDVQKLGSNDCYVCHGSEGIHYKNVIF